MNQYIIPVNFQPEVNSPRDLGWPLVIEDTKTQKAIRFGKPVSLAVIWYQNGYFSSRRKEIMRR